MSRTMIVAVLAATALLGVSAAPAQAAGGQIVLFSTELQPLNVYQNPVGCQQLPPTAHVLDNLTDQPVMVYADPKCTIPATLPVSGLGVLRPGYGSHVTGIGSFAVPAAS